MKDYILFTNTSIKELDSLKRNFESTFGVNLDDEKYNKFEGIEEKWMCIVEDIFSRYTQSAKDFYGKDFLQMFDWIESCENDPIIRDEETDEKVKRECKTTLKRHIEESYYLFEDYYIYESDVWINAYLSVLYIKNEGKDDLFDIEPGYVEVKGIKYEIPFRNHPEGFCKAYSKKILDKDNVQILDIRNEDKESYEDCMELYFKGYKKKTILEFSLDKKYKRWSRDKVLELEHSEGFQTEDRILFHKTINGILIRNLVDSLISTKYENDVEDYLYLLDKLCAFKSLLAQNLIGTLFIIMNKYQYTLTKMDLWIDVRLMFSLWLSKVNVMNRRLKLLTGGLLYLIYNYDSEFKDIAKIKNKCDVLIQNIEEYHIPFTKEQDELIKKEWEQKREEKDYRVTKKVINNHREYYWVYAIMQRRAIRSMTPRISKKMVREEMNWSQFINNNAIWYSDLKERWKNIKRERRVRAIRRRIEGVEVIIDLKKILYICEKLVKTQNISKEGLSRALLKKVVKQTDKDYKEIALKEEWEKILDDIYQEFNIFEFRLVKVK